jgi:hypothetical protein
VAFWLAEDWKVLKMREVCAIGQAALRPLANSPRRTAIRFKQAGPIALLICGLHLAL